MWPLGMMRAFFYWVLYLVAPRVYHNVMEWDTYDADDNDEEYNEITGYDIPPVYTGHEGFTPKQASVLDELLPRWNAYVRKWVERSVTQSLRYGLTIRESGFGRGLGVFNGPYATMPRGITVCYVFGALARSSSSEPAAAGGAYITTNTYCLFNFSKQPEERNLYEQAHINSRAVNGSGRPKYAELCARMNHACRPTCESHSRDVRVGSIRTGQCLTLQLVYYTTLVEIAPDQELTLDYGPDYVMDSPAAVKHARRSYRWCRCENGGCPFGRVIMLVPF